MLLGGYVEIAVALLQIFFVRCMSDNVVTFAGVARNGPRPAEQVADSARGEKLPLSAAGEWFMPLLLCFVVCDLMSFDIYGLKCCVTGDQITLVASACAIFQPDAPSTTCNIPISHSIG